MLLSGACCVVTVCKCSCASFANANTVLLPLATPPQGIKWIKNREGPAGLVILQQSQPKYVDKVMACIEQVSRGESG